MTPSRLIHSLAMTFRRLSTRSAGAKGGRPSVLTVAVAGRVRGGQRREAGSAARRVAASGGRLEDLDRVAGGVVDEYLSTSGSADYVVAEIGAGDAEALDLGVDVVDDEMDAVPASWFGLRPSASAARPSSPGLRAAAAGCP